MKKALVLILVLVMLSFTACGSEGDSSSITSIPLNSPSAESTENVSSNSAFDAPSQSVSTPQSAPSPELAPSSQSVDVEAIKAENPVGVLTGIASQPSDTGFAFSGVTTVMSADKMFAESGDPVDANVVYSPNVVFERCRYYRATDTSEIFPATIDEVVNGCDVTLWGEYSGTDFVATLVAILELA